MPSALVAAMEQFTSPQDEQQLRALDQALNAAAPSSCAKPEFEALLRVFERFPEEDGFGVFWSIVHILRPRPATRRSS